MDSLLESLFSSDYMPHGHCYWWKPEILWLNVISDLLIATAYFSIPIAIYYFVKRRKDLEFKGIFILFSLFILFCGITHVVSIFVIWHGIYGVHGLAKLATAIVSCITAYKVFEAVPKALSLPSPAALRDAYEKVNQEKLERLKLENEKQQELILRESTDSAHIGIFVVDDDGLIQVANDAACQIFEYEKSELEGFALNLVLPDSVKTRHIAYLHQFFDSSTQHANMASDRVVNGRTQSGREVPIEVRLNKRRYGDKTLVFASFQDISARLAAEKALKASEQMTRSIIASLPIGLHVFKLSGGELILQTYNQSADNILGINHSALVDKRVEDAFPELADSDIPHIYKNIAQNGGTWTNKSLSYKDSVISGIFDVTCFQSSPNTAIAMFEDITAQHLAEKAIKEKDFFIESAFNASITGVYIYNSEKHRFEYINNTFTSITGFSLKDLNNNNSEILLLDRCHENDREAINAHWNALNQVAPKQSVFKLEYQLKNKQEKWVSVLQQDVPLERNENGSVVRFVGSLLDITDIKRLQDNLLQTKEMAEKANAAKSEFLANMSHEIRTPMNAILGLTHLVLQMDLGQKQYEYLNKVESSSKSLLNILNDVLDYSKMEAGKLELSEEEFELEVLIEDTVGLFALLAEDKNIELVVELHPSLHQNYTGDPLRISQILNNLVGNAIKFTETGYVRISAKEEQTQTGKFVTFCIEDTGIGISEEQLQRLFESFTQADSSIMRKYGGTGLGLTISQALTQLMGGWIDVNSEQGKGSTFKVSVPLQPTSNLLFDRSGALIPLKTLIVDNNEPSRFAIEGLLTDWGFTVDTCESGGQALAKIDQSIAGNHPYELFIVDWKMPIMDGIELTRRIKSKLKDSSSKDEPVIIMATAYGKQFAEQQGEDAGVCAYLDKPVLNSKIRQILFSLQQGTLPTKNISARARKSAERSQSFTGLRALIVEDNFTNQMVLTELLKQLGFSTYVANHGKEAVEVFDKEHFDMILMDLQMPVMDGFTAAQMIRDSAKGAKVPIIAVSAAAMQTDIAKVKAHRMNGHIAKPINAEKLYTTLRTCLEANYSSDESNPQSITHLDSSDYKAITPQAFDTVSALEHLQGNKNLYTQVLSSFIVNHANSPELLIAYLRESKFDKIERLAHTIKGLAGTMGALQLQQIASEVELSLQQQKPVDIHPLVNQLSSDISNVRAVLSALPQQAASQVKQDDSVENFRAAIDALIIRLKDNEFTNIDQLGEVLGPFTHRIGANQLGKLFECIDQLEYEVAIRILEGFK